MRHPECFSLDALMSQWMLIQNRGGELSKLAAKPRLSQKQNVENFVCAEGKCKKNFRLTLRAFCSIIVVDF